MFIRWKEKAFINSVKSIENQDLIILQIFDGIY